jgi:hypothetical protein
MTPIRHILRIYAHHRLVLQVMLPITGGFGIAAHVLLAMSYPRTAWCVFLFAIAFSTVASGFIMGQALKEGEETDLVPSYRAHQMTSAFAFPSLLILWALAFTANCGRPILATLALFLSTAVLSLWYGLYCLNGLLFRDNSWMIRFLCFSGLRPFWVYWFIFQLTQPFSLPGFFILSCIVCISGMTTWFGAYFLNNLSALAGGAAILWMLHDIFRISEFADASSWIGEMFFRSERLGDFRLYSLLTLSLLALLLICIRYWKYIYIFEWDVYMYSTDPYWSSYSYINYDGPKFPYMFSPESWQRDHLVCLWNRDKTHRLGVDKAERLISGRKIKADKERDFVPLRSLNQLLRFGLFSPIFVVGTDWLTFVGFCIVGTLGAFYYCLTANAAAALNIFLPGVYFFSAAVLANDFQGHRNRLPLLYFQTALPSRTAFLKQSLTAYLWSASRISLLITLTALFMHPLISWSCKKTGSPKQFSAKWIAAAAAFHWSWNDLSQMIVMGIGLALGQIAVSLIVGNRRAYAGGPGWLAINALLLVPITFIAARCHSWPMSIAVVFVSVALFLHAERRWLNIELDFA